jgi:hypothetical protein
MERCQSECLYTDFGRGGAIRTPDPLRPRQVRYQAALRPDICWSLYSRPLPHSLPIRIYLRKVSPCRHQEIVRGVSKQNLPAKVCLVCGRPFSWRKRWERVWEDVKYCSDRCRAKRKAL